MQQQDPPEIMSPPELSDRVERARVEKLAHEQANGLSDGEE